MAEFPRKDIIAATYLLQDGSFFSAYLKLPNVIFNITMREPLDRVGYIPGEAKRIEFKELPTHAQAEFRETLSGFGLLPNARGLERISEWVEVEAVNGFTILKKRRKFRVNPVRVRHEGKEVWKGQTIEAALAYIEGSL